MEQADGFAAFGQRDIFPVHGHKNFFQNIALGNPVLFILHPAPGPHFDAAIHQVQGVYHRPGRFQQHPGIFDHDRFHKLLGPENILHVPDGNVAWSGHNQRS